MLKLYDTGHKVLCGLTGYTNYHISKAKGELDKLYFTYSLDTPNFSGIKKEGYIGTEKNGEYVIKEINRTGGDTRTAEIVADLNIEAIQGGRVDSIHTTDMSAEDTTNEALAGTGWEVGTCDVTKKRSVKKSQCSAYDVLKEIQTAFSCEMEYDTVNKRVNIYVKRGSDKGVYFAEQLNLKQLDTQESSRDLITRLIPLGKDNLTIKSVNLTGNDWIENTQYCSKIIYGYWTDNRYTVAQDLYDDAVERLNYLSKPTIAYKADIIDLARVSPDKYKILDYDYGDTIILIADSQGTREQQRIVKVDIYPDEPEKNTCELSNKIASLDDLNVRFADTADTVDDDTETDGTILGSKVDGATVTHIQMANVDELNATVAHIGTLYATKADITDLHATNAEIDNLKATKADIGDLTAVTARVTTLEADDGTIVNLLSNNAGISNLSAADVKAAYAALATASLGDAQITKLTAAAITSGTVDTSKVTIAGANSRLKISGNRLQIFADDSNGNLFERVCVGDISNDGKDYGITLRAADGKTVLLDPDGLTKEGITSGYNKADDGSLSAAKLDKESVVTAVNGATTTIKGSKVYLDQQGQTADVAFTTINSTVTGQGQMIATHTAGIQANAAAIALKLDSSTFTTYKTSNDSAVQNLTTEYNTQQTALTAVQGQITSKVWDKDISTAVNELTGISRNLVLKSNLGWTTTGCNIMQGTLSQTWIVGATYTITVSGTLNSGQKMGLWRDGGFALAAWLTYDTSSGLWKATFQCPEAYSTDTAHNNLSIYNYPSSTATSASIDWIKIEQGSVASGWSPAPEDTQGQIDTVNTTITNQQSEINQTKSDISLRVLQSTYDTDKTTINGNITSLTSRMSTAESSISAQAGQIALKVDSSYVQQSISNVQNGKNLILNSDFSRGTMPGSTIAPENWSFIRGAYQGNTSKIPRTLCIGCSTESSTIIQALDLQPNTQYTISFNANKESNIIGNYSEVEYYDSSGKFLLSSQFAYDYSSPDTIQHFTFTTPSSFGTAQFAHSGRSSTAGTNCMISLGNVKLELGSVPTPWSAAPEDTQGQIDTANGNISTLQTRMSSAELKINPDNIVSTVRTSSAYVTDLAGKTSSKDVESIISQSSTQVQTAFNGATGMFTIKNGNLQVQNSSGTNVMWVDSATGWLTTNFLSVISSADASVRIQGNGNKGVELRSGNGGVAYIDFSADLYTDYDSRLAKYSNSGALFIEGSDGVTIRADGNNNAAPLTVIGQVNCDTISVGGLDVIKQNGNIRRMDWVYDQGYLQLMLSNSVCLQITTTSSDTRLKCDIVDSREDDLAKLRLAKIIDFDWNSKSMYTGHIRSGFNAQNLQAIDANFVAEVYQPGGPFAGQTLLQPRLETILPATVHAVQQLADKGDSRDMEISMLKCKVSALRAENDNLQSRVAVLEAKAA